MPQVNIDHMIDPERPGYLKPYIMLAPNEYIEACKRGLKSYKGSDLTLVETSENPESLKVLRREAPEEFHKNLEEAEDRVEKGRALYAMDDENYKSERDKLAKFWQDMGGSELTEAGKVKLSALNLAFHRAEAPRNNSKNILEEEIVKHLQCRLRLDGWARNELIRRQEEEAARKAAAEKRAGPTLAERWAKFTQKLTG